MKRIYAILPLVPRLALFKKIRRVASRVKNVKIGNNFTKLARHIFEHKNTRRLLGTNLALAIAVSSFLPHEFNIDVSADNSPVIVASLESDMNTEITVRYPLKDIKINQGYRLFHPGIDFDGVTGDPVYPIMKGVVETVEYSRFAYGNSIVINHNNGFQSRYAHLSKVEVALGIEVDPFTVIGEVGSTGRSTGSHLHLEVYENMRNVNPLTILSRQSR